jgi:hypothetical protein
VSFRLLEQFPGAWLAIGGTIVTVLIACSLHALVQRLFPHEMLRRHNEVAGVLLTVVGTLYSVILGFVVVVVWQGFTTASDVASQEANAAAYVYRLARGLPPPAGTAIRRAVTDYAQSVLTKEWPRMISGGKSDPATGILARRLANEVVSYNPKTAGQSDLHVAMLGAIGEFVNDRRQRLTYLDSRIPGILWGVLVFGGFVLLALAFMIGLENRVVQLIMTGALAAMIGLSLVTIFELDSPLEGSTHVEPTAWHLFADQSSH